MRNLENVNLTAYNGKDVRGYQGDWILKLPSTNNGVVLLSTVSLLLFVTIVFAVAFALKRCTCVKSDKMTSSEHQMESSDPVLEQPPAEQKLQRTSVDRFLAQPSLDDLLDSVHQDLHPEIGPTTSANYYQHNRHEQQQQQQHQQQQQQQQQLSLSSGTVSKQDHSLLSCNDAETNSCNYRARIWFSVTFDTAEVPQQQMNIHISKVELDVSPSDLMGLERWEEAFVSVYLLPDESHQLRTKTVDRTGSSLIIDQTLVFKFGHPPCLAEPLLPSALRLSVYQIDRRRLRHTLGHVIVTLDDRSDLGSGDVMVCKDLISDEALSNYNSLGEIRLSMTYDPEANRLKVTVIEARSLRQLDPHKDPYVLVELLTGDQWRKTKRISNRNSKTSEVSSDEDTTCPAPSDRITYRKSVHFTLPPSHLDISSVQVSILTATDRAGHSGEVDVEYGRTTLGPYMYARDDQLAHWTMVTTQPYETVAMWHRLTSADGRIH